MRLVYIIFSIGLDLKFKLNPKYIAQQVITFFVDSNKSFVNANDSFIIVDTTNLDLKKMKSFILGNNYIFTKSIINKPG